MRDQRASAWVNGEAPVGSDPDVDIWTAESPGSQRALRAAGLIDAVRCVIGAAGARERRARQSALRWFHSRDVRAPFSFPNVGESLGLDPVRLRRMLFMPSLGADGVTRIMLGM